MRYVEFKISETLNATVAPQTTSGFELVVPTNKFISPQIADVQKALIALGYGNHLGRTGKNHDGVDGVRGPYTRSAIQDFQKDNSLTVDGDPGEQTIKALNSALAARPELKITKSSEDDIPPTVRNVLGKNKVTSVSDVDVSDIDDAEFENKLKLIAKKLGVGFRDLYTIIKTETKGTFSPSSLYKSAKSKFKAGGLIGFTEKTAAKLGTTLDELLQMTATEQLDYVYKFYRLVGVKPGMDRGDIYMLTFMPSYAYHPDNTVLGQQHGGELGTTGLSMHRVWEQNPIFGKNHGKSFFTVGDVKNTIRNKA